MSKEKISQWDTNPANNTDVGGINIAENCPPANINNAIREVMSQVKNFQDGSSGDSLTLNGSLQGNANNNFPNHATAKTMPAGENSNKIATTAYVDRETGSLGTIAKQDANAVAITGGNIGVLTKTGQDNSILMREIGTNAVGKKTVSSLSPSGGVSGDVWYKV
jgi:selenophosphate synthetase-related protein